MSDLFTIIQSYVSARYLRKWVSVDSFRAWQEQQIVKHVKTVRQASSFYRDYWEGIPDVRWRGFPMIDKHLMMEHFNELNTVGVDEGAAMELAIQSERSRDFTPMLNGVTIGLSSGTSGHRGIFLVSKHERLTWAGTILAKVLPKSILHREKVAFFLRANSQLYSSVQSKRIQFSYYDLLNPVEQHIQSLNEYQPTIIVAPPSLLRMLAEATKRGTLKVKPIKLISVAEVLESIDRNLIETAFGQTLHQVYQCTEGFLASTCSYGTLHFNEDIVHIEKEYIDEASKKFIPIVTDFSRISQPIIRYRLNDIITEQDGCPCGSYFTAIQSIEGRSDDLFYLPAAHHSSYVPVFPDFISRAVMMATNELSEYRVIQWDQERVQIMTKLTRDGKYEVVKRQITDALNQLFQRLGCMEPQLEFTPYSPPERGMKLRRVERKWSYHEGGDK